MKMKFFSFIAIVALMTNESQQFDQSLYEDVTGALTALVASRPEG
jgi:hypothetical protein